MLELDVVVKDINHVGVRGKYLGFVRVVGEDLGHIGVVGKGLGLSLR